MPLLGLGLGEKRTWPASTKNAMSHRNNLKTDCAKKSEHSRSETATLERHAGKAALWQLGFERGFLNSLIRGAH